MQNVTSLFIENAKAHGRSFKAFVVVHFIKKMALPTATVSSQFSPENNGDQACDGRIEFTDYKMDGLIDARYKNAHLGWWSNGVSDANSAIHETITIVYPQNLTTKNFWFISDLGSYPVDFIVEYFDDSASSWVSLFNVVGNANSKWVGIAPSKVTFSQLRMTVNKMNGADKRVMLAHFGAVNTVVFETGSLIDFDLLEEIKSNSSDPVGGVSSNECTITFNNEEYWFNQNNNQSPFYGLLKPNLRFEPFIGIQVPGMNLVKDSLTMSSWTYFRPGNQNDITVLEGGIANGVMRLHFTRAAGSTGADYRIMSAATNGIFPYTIDKTKEYLMTFDFKIDTIPTGSGIEFVIKGPVVSNATNAEKQVFQRTTGGNIQPQNGCTIVSNQLLSDGFRRVTAKIPVSFWTGTGDTCQIVDFNGWQQAGTYDIYFRRPILMPVETKYLYEFTPLGVFKSEDWRNPKNSLEASLTGYDRLREIMELPVPPALPTKNNSVGQLFAILFGGLGIPSSEYSIDPSIISVVPYGWIPNGQVGDALKAFCIAGGCNVIVRRDNVIAVRKNVTSGFPVDTIDDDSQIVFAENPTKFLDIYSEVEVQYSQSNASESIEVLSASGVNIPNGTSAIELRFSEGPVIIVDYIQIDAPTGVALGSIDYNSWAISLTITNTTGSSKKADIAIFGRSVSAASISYKVSDSNLVSEWGRKTYTVKNPLIQTEAVAAAYGAQILDLLKNPASSVPVDLRGNPAYEVNDIISISDASDRVYNMNIVIERMNLKYDGGLESNILGRKV